MKSQNVKISFRTFTEYTISLHDFSESKIPDDPLVKREIILDNRLEQVLHRDFDNSFLVSLLSLFIGFQSTGSIKLSFRPIKPKKTNLSVIPMFKVFLLIRVIKTDKKRYHSTLSGIKDIIKAHKFHKSKKTNNKIKNFRKFFFKLLFWRKFHGNFPLDALVYKLLAFSYDKLPSSTSNLLDLLTEENSPLLLNTPDSTDPKSIPIGYQIADGLIPFPIQSISLEDLSSHISCFGLTSQGKSRFIYHFLSQLPQKNIRFFVFDSKGEYLVPVTSSGCDFEYFKPGSTDQPIQLDIFQIPDDLNAEEHLNFLYALFLQVVGDTSTPQMDRLIYLSIKEVLNNNGSFQDFISCLENPTSIGLIGAHLELSSSGIMNRILPLTTGIAGSCFNVTKSTINYDILLHNNVILDLSPFEDLENNAARKIFTNVLYYYMLHYLRKHRAKIRQPDDIKNVIVIEEAQKIVPIAFEGKTEVRSILGMSAWTARAYGISMVFVGTDPVVESSILSNTGLSILFYSKSDPYQIAKLSQMSFEDYQNFLPLLRNRQVFLFSNKSKVHLCRSFDYSKQIL